MVMLFPRTRRLTNYYVKIGHGKYAGEARHKVPTIPNHNDLLTLLRFV